MNNVNMLLSEQLRPSSFQDIVLPQTVRDPLERMVENKNIMNMIFYGKPGIGKTSAARILLKELDANVYELNGSFNHGDKTMVKAIETFAHNVSITGTPKVCFIDEADHMSKSNQDALRYTIERTSASTRFLMTANDIQKLTPALKSRCIPICFDQKPLDAMILVEELAERYQSKLSVMGFKMEPQRIREIVGLSYPDMRMIANKIELEAA